MDLAQFGEIWSLGGFLIQDLIRILGTDSKDFVNFRRRFSL